MRIAIALILSCIFTSNCFAHHDLSEDADLGNLNVFGGTVTKVEWMNPHVKIHVQARTTYASTTGWTIEADSPNALLRRGISRATLFEMRDINFAVYRSLSKACSSECHGYGLNLTTSTGRVVILHTALNELLTKLH